METQRIIEFPHKNMDKRPRKRPRLTWDMPPPPPPTVCIFYFVIFIILIHEKDWIFILKIGIFIMFRWFQLYIVDMNLGMEQCPITHIRQCFTGLVCLLLVMVLLLGDLMIKMVITSLLLEKI